MPAPNLTKTTEGEHEPAQPASPEVEVILVRVKLAAERLPVQWRQAADRLCDDARRVGIAEYAEVVLKCVRQSRVPTFAPRQEPQAR
jgi:hypothetical protein